MQKIPTIRADYDGREIRRSMQTNPTAGPESGDTGEVKEQASERTNLLEDVPETQLDALLPMLRGRSSKLFVI